MSMTADSVSIVIPTYNRSRVITRAVTSALTAASSEDEVIVVDDGSTDNTREILQPFGDKLRYVYTEHSGAGHARNVGIRLATQPLIAFLDSDDEWLPDKLHLQRAVMGRFPEVVFSFTDAMAQRAEGQIVHHMLDLWRHDDRIGCSDAKSLHEELCDESLSFSHIAQLPAGRKDFTVYFGDVYLPLMEAYCVWTCSIMVRKNAAGASISFPEDQNIFEEWDCFARLAKIGRAAYLDCETAVQHVHREGRLTDLKDTLQATARLELLSRLWGTDELVRKRYAHRYHALLKALYLRRARLLIKEGRALDAKQDLQKAGGGPWFYPIVTSLPQPIIRTLIGTRRRLLDLVSR
jgi:glycosyltransferase involved in cell wall biosynthesis